MQNPSQDRVDELWLQLEQPHRAVGGVEAGRVVESEALGGGGAGGAGEVAVGGRVPRQVQDFQGLIRIGLRW